VQITAQRIPTDANGYRLSNNPSGSIIDAAQAMSPDEQRAMEEVVVSGRRILPGEDVGLDLFALMSQQRAGRSPVQQGAIDQLGDLAELSYRLRQRGVQPTHYLREALADQVTFATGQPRAGQIALSTLDQEARIRAPGNAGAVLPEFDESSYFAPGFVASAFYSASAEVENGNNSFGYRATNLGLAIAAAPLAIGEEIGRGILNIPYGAKRLGQDLAIAGLTDDPFTRNLALLDAVSSGASSFTAAGSVVPVGAAAGAWRAGTMPVQSAAELDAIRLTYSGASDAEFVGPLIGRSGFKSTGELSDALYVRYQTAVDDAYTAAVAAERDGLLTGNPNTRLGRAVDDAARADIRAWLKSEGIGDGPGGLVDVNRWLRDPTGSGAYVVPDVRITGAQQIFDATVGTKWSTTPQIVNFRNFSLGDRITIVRPTPLGGSYSILW